MPTPTWTHLKPHLDRLDHAALVDLLGDLYALNAGNRTFLAARFLATTPEALAAPYRRIVHDTAHTGWGFHDDLTAAYCELLPPKDETT